MNEGLPMYLKSFRLPTMAAIVDEQIKLAEAEDWGYGRFLTGLCEAVRSQKKAPGLPGA